MPTRIDLAADLRRLGLRPGDRVVVHSSLRSIGRVDGGADAVVGSLLDVLGDDGLLVAPAFTYRAGRFDPRAEPGATGRIAEAIRTHPAAVRSWHPTHSVAAIGLAAAALCAGHHLVGGLSVGSPLDRLARQDGCVLLVGVGHAADSTVHVGEARAGVPYLDVPFRPEDPRRATVETDDGPVDVPIRQPPGCSRAFGVVEQPLRRGGAIRDGLVGSALAQLVRGRDVVAAVGALLRAEPSALLCTDPACHRCVAARRLVGGGVA